MSSLSSRRFFLQLLMFGGGAAALAACGGTSSSSIPPLGEPGFPQGVFAGDPTPEGQCSRRGWCRLAAWIRWR